MIVNNTGIDHRAQLSTLDLPTLADRSKPDPKKMLRWGSSLDVFSQANKLSMKGLIGKETMVSMSLGGGKSGIQGETRVSYWSEKNHAQWQAYQQDGSDAGKQAAGLLKKMISERQQLATDYLEGVMNLANKFNAEGFDGIAFHQTFDKDERGDPLGLMVDGSMNKDSDVIEQFWQDNKEEIDQLKSVYNDLKSFPKDIESWIDQRDIDTNDDINLIIDRLKNSWAQGSVEVGDDYKPNSTFFADNTDSASHQSIDGDQPDHLSLTRNLEESLNNSARTWGRMGWLDNMDNIAAKELHQQQQSNIYQEMQTVSKGMFSQFDGLFAQTTGTESYSLQDMVDNYINNQPLAKMDNGVIHPNAEEIEQFWQDNKLALEKYSSDQKKLNDLPNNSYDFLKRYPEEVRLHLLANLDRLLHP